MIKAELKVLVFSRMISEYQVLLFVSLLCFAIFNGRTNADEIKQQEARLNIGYYFKTLNEFANRTDIEISLNFWTRELFDVEAKKHNFTITSASHAFLFDSMEDLRDAFSNGQLDMILAPPLLINKYFKPEELGDGFVGVLAETQHEALILLARTDKNINTIKDIRGKRLAMINNDELAEVFIDTLVLKDQHKSYKKMNLSIQFQKKIDRIVLDVYFDKADIGVVFTSSYNLMVEMNPDIKNKVKILKEYPIKARNFSFFRHDYPYIKEFTEAGIDFPNMTRGKQLLDVFKTSAIDYCKVEDLVVFKTFYNEYLQLKKAYDK